MARTTRALIDLEALRSNFEVLKDHTQTGNNLAVIKADAYGHGAVEVARALDSVVDLFAVAFMDEAQQLRESGINQAIVSLQGVFDPAEAQWAAQNNVWIVVHQLEQLHWIDAIQGAKPVVWLKLDTGLHRLGLSQEQLRLACDQFAHLLDDNSVLLTHLASAANLENEQTNLQLQRFSESAVSNCPRASIANTAGVMNWPEAQSDWNRLGIGLYGGFIAPEVDAEITRQLQAVMTFEAPVIALRTIEPGETVGYGATWTANKRTQLATVSAGYADGYPRHAPNGTPAICNDQRIALVGRVSMDMLIFDVTDCASIAIGDRVELWGKQLPASEIAELAGTIDYELMTRVTQRVPRVYQTRN